MSTSRNLLKSARLFHLYCGVFITPALLFFAFTGAVQTFSLHETTRGSSYKPPEILVTLAQLHKKQTIVVPPPRKAPPPDAKPAASASTPEKSALDPTVQPKHDRPADGPPAPTPPRPAPDTPPAKKHNLLPMKIFFLLVSIGLLSSTLTGLYMAYKFTRRPAVITVTFVAGIAIPLMLLLF